MKVKTNIWDPFLIVALCLTPGIIYYSVNHQNIYKLAYFLLFCIFSACVSSLLAFS